MNSKKSFLLKIAFAIFLTGFAIFASAQQVWTQHQKKLATEWVVNSGSISYASAARIVNLAHSYGQKRSIEPALVLSVIKKESTFKATARNPRSNASGLMQVMPRWHKDKINRGESWFDPAVNIRAGTQVLGDCKKKFGGNRNRALSCFYGGPCGAYCAKINRDVAALRRHVGQSYAIKSLDDLILAVASN